MSTAEIPTVPLAMTPEPPIGPPDHPGLPESDGRIVENHLEHPQGMILSDSLLPVLMRGYPDGQFALGRDLGIYYKWRPDEPPLSGAIAPDWFYVPDVPATLDGEYHRSYVLWTEPGPRPDRPGIRLRRRLRGAGPHASEGEILGRPVRSPSGVLRNLRSERWNPGDVRTLRECVPTDGT